MDSSPAANSLSSFANGDERFCSARGSTGFSYSPDDREFGSAWDYGTRTPRQERDWDVETVRNWDVSHETDSPSRYVRSLQEEIQRLQEEVKGKDEEIRKKDEGTRKKDEEIRKKDEEIRRKDEELRRKDEEVKKFEQELRKMQVEVRRKAEEEHKAQEKTKRNREKKKKERDSEAESSSERDDSDRNMWANGPSYGHTFKHGQPSTSWRPASRSASPKGIPPPLTISPPASPSSPPPNIIPFSTRRRTTKPPVYLSLKELAQLGPAERAHYQFEQQQWEYHQQLAQRRRSYKPSLKQVAHRGGA